MDTEKSDAAPPERDTCPKLWVSVSDSGNLAWWRRKLNSEQVCQQLYILVLLSPEVEWNRSQFVDDWYSEALLGEVHCLDVVKQLSQASTRT